MKKFAYYLPQYHTIPENDEWWGKGFTEWTNVKKAKPLFRGHQQPVHPLDGNYYILDNPNVLKWQAQLALKYGIDGLIFYHYYFCGKKLLEKPAEILLNNTDIPMHFFFCWANHDWYRSWEGSKALLMQQKYGGIEEWENHFQYLLPFFKDERYEKKDNKPIFMLYKCEFNEKYEMISYFNKRCIESGFDGISVIETFNHDAGERKDTFDTLLSGFMNKVSSSTDYIHLRQPTEVLNWYRTLPEYSFSRIWNKLGRISRVFGTHFIEKYDGTRLFKVMTRYHVHKSGIINGLFMQWDNTPRHSFRGYVISAPSKSAFFAYLDAIKDEEFVFINAWNEWCEGMMLEPTEENGYKYLEWIKEWNEKNEDWVNGI